MKPNIAQKALLLPNEQYMKPNIAQKALLLPNEQYMKPNIGQKALLLPNEQYMKPNIAQKALLLPNQHMENHFLNLFISTTLRPAPLVLTLEPRGRKTNTNLFGCITLN